MKRFLFLLLALTTVFSAGCFHFRKKDRKPKESTAIATPRSWPKACAPTSPASRR